MHRFMAINLKILINYSYIACHHATRPSPKKNITPVTTLPLTHPLHTNTKTPTTTHQPLTTCHYELVFEKKCNLVTAVNPNVCFGGCTSKAIINVFGFIFSSLRVLFFLGAPSN